MLTGAWINLQLPYRTQVQCGWRVVKASLHIYLVKVLSLIGYNSSSQILNVAVTLEFDYSGENVT